MYNSRGSTMSDTSATFEGLDMTEIQKASGDHPDPPTLLSRLIEGKYGNLVILALYCVSTCFRPLTAEELYAAVMTVAKDKQLAEVYGKISSHITYLDMMSMCSSFLAVRSDNTVFIRQMEMRTYIMTSDLFTALTGHGIMAQVCLKYIEDLDGRIVLQPWHRFGELTNDRTSHPLYTYATEFWAEHYRLAEADCGRLPAQLHRIIEAAWEEENPSSKKVSDFEFQRQVLDIGLEISVIYDFKVLTATYVQMGADVNGIRRFVHEPLWQTAQTKSPRLLEILDSRQASHSWGEKREDKKHSRPCDWLWKDGCPLCGFSHIFSRLWNFLTTDNATARGGDATDLHLAHHPRHGDVATNSSIPCWHDIFGDYSHHTGAHAGEDGNELADNNRPVILEALYNRRSYKINVDELIPENRSSISDKNCKFTDSRDLAPSEACIRPARSAMCKSRGDHISLTESTSSLSSWDWILPEDMVADSISGT